MDDSEPYRLYRSRRGNRRRWLILANLVMLPVASILVYLAWSHVKSENAKAAAPGRAAKETGSKADRGPWGTGFRRAALDVQRPSATVEGIHWNHKQLLKYLNSAGMKLDMQRWDDRTMLFYVPRDYPTLHEIEYRDQVFVELLETPRVASDRAGMRANAWNWGRFVLIPNPESKPLFGDVRDALVSD